MESQLPLSADPTGGSAVPKLEPRHRPPAAPPPAPPRGQQCHEATPPRPSSESPPAERNSGVPGPLRAVTSTRTTPVSVVTATVIVSPGPPSGYGECCCRTFRSPAVRRRLRTGAQDRAPRPRTLGRHAPAPPARQASRSPGSLAQPSGTQAGCTGMLSQLSRTRQAGTRDRRGPSVAVRGKPTVPSTVLAAGRRPPYVRGHRDTPVHSATR